MLERLDFAVHGGVPVWPAGASLSFGGRLQIVISIDNKCVVDVLILGGLRWSGTMRSHPGAVHVVGLLRQRYSRRGSWCALVRTGICAGKSFAGAAGGAVVVLGGPEGACGTS